jgi:hypothetical protein
MGKTVKSPKGVLDDLKNEVFKQYLEALRKEDKLAAINLFRFAHQHLAESAYASNALPMETYLFSMLLEVHKAGLHQQMEIDRLTTELNWLNSAIEKNAGNKLNDHL